MRPVTTAASSPDTYPSRVLRHFNDETYVLASRGLSSPWPVEPLSLTAWESVRMGLPVSSVGRGRGVDDERQFSHLVEEFGLWSVILKRLGQRNMVFPGYMVALCGRSEERRVGK